MNIDNVGNTASIWVYLGYSLKGWYNIGDVEKLLFLESRYTTCEHLIFVVCKINSENELGFV